MRAKKCPFGAARSAATDGRCPPANRGVQKFKNIVLGGLRCGAVFRIF